MGFIEKEGAEGKDSARSIVQREAAMDKEKLDAEFAEYAPEELEYIHETQQDLYTADELAYMLEVAEAKKQAIREKAAEYLPDTIECEKCGAENPFSNDVCQYCEHRLDKTEYLERAHRIASGEEDECEDDGEGGEGPAESYTFQRVLSFLIPLVGIIMGAVMLGGESAERRVVGKNCIILAVVGAAVWLAVYLLLLTPALLD